MNTEQRFTHTTDLIIQVLKQLGEMRVNVEKSFGEVRSGIAVLEGQMKHVPSDKEIDSKVRSEMIVQTREMMIDVRALTIEHIEKALDGKTGKPVVKKKSTFWNKKNMVLIGALVGSALASAIATMIGG